MQRISIQSLEQPYALQISTDKHKWIGDEPVDLGGGDQGPSPFEFLLSSVGSCTAITAQMYARRKNWPLESIEVGLEHNKIEAEECPDCKTEKGKISQITIRLSFQGPLSDGQKARLADIAARCPVKRSLEGEIVFRSSFST